MTVLKNPEGVEETPEGLELDLRVKRVTQVNISARVTVGDYTVTARSQKRGIRLNIKKLGSYYSEDITIPNDLFDVFGDIFTAVKEAKEKEEANG